MEMLGRYEMTTALSNKNAGTCRWCFAIRGGREYFIKEFLEPKYPENDTTSTPEKKAKKIQKCLIFQDKKAKMYQTINEYSDGNAVRVVDFFRIGAKYYMAMPKIQAVQMDIMEIFELPEHSKRRLCSIIAHAVAQLHKGHFVHADIKHTNVMLTWSRKRALSAKLIDYDAGFFEDDPPTVAEEIHGDQVYFSPEAWRAILGEEMSLTCKLDVFALGVLFHQYLSGQLPIFDEEQFSCAGEAVAMGASVQLSNRIPEDLHSLLQQMLANDPNERPSAQQVFRLLANNTELSYQVLHCVDGAVTEVCRFSQTATPSQNENIAVTAESLMPRQYTGYQFDGVEPSVAAGHLIGDGMTITMKYSKDLSQQKNLSYTVRHILDGQLADEIHHTRQVWIHSPDELYIEESSLVPRTYAGYMFRWMDQAVKAGGTVVNGTIISMHYTAVPPVSAPVVTNDGFIGDAPAQYGFRSMGDL